MLSLLWKLPSKLTSIFDINLLLTDSENLIYLQNGMKIHHNEMSAMSFDLSGLAVVSIWNQNAKTVIKPRLFSIFNFIS
jgi:hypothetical protein